jgi:hypothetical protein
VHAACCLVHFVGGQRRFGLISIDWHTQCVKEHVCVTAHWNTTLRAAAAAAALCVPCSLFGQDVLEFVIKPEQPTGQLVTYRSMAGTRPLVQRVCNMHVADVACVHLLQVAGTVTLGGGGVGCTCHRPASCRGGVTWEGCNPHNCLVFKVCEAACWGLHQLD